MYNLAISIGISAALFVFGWLVAGTWVAGFIPAMLAVTITYFLLARRTGRKLEALMSLAMVEFQASRVDKGRKILEGGFALGPWQFLMAAQIHGQLGALDYMQRNYKRARVHLDKAWSRNWMAKAMLAAIDLREKKHDAALERLDKLRGPGKKDPTFWGLYAYTALEAGDRDKALAVLNDGLQKCEDSNALKTMTDQVRNKKKIKMKAFAPAWYQFFPEHMPRSVAMGYQQQRQGYGPPQPRGGRPR